MPITCHVINCKAPAIARGLCSTHYKRLQRNNSTEQTRPTDWGQREKHPAYKAWCGLMRHHHFDMDPTWVKDFWNFVKDIPKKPENVKSNAFRGDQTQPWGKDNFYWRELRDPDLDKNKYMREYSRNARANNPEYYKNADLKRTYGVTLDWYNEQLEKQNNTCAICKQPETAKIKNKLLSLAVDHCHESGKIRGLLCRSCNNAIGALKHDEGILNAAIEYLRK
jgi:hypothetical protein